MRKPRQKSARTGKNDNLWKSQMGLEVRMAIGFSVKTTVCCFTISLSGVKTYLFKPTFHLKWAPERKFRLHTSIITFIKYLLGSGIYWGWNTTLLKPFWHGCAIASMLLHLWYLARSGAMKRWRWANGEMERIKSKHATHLHHLKEAYRQKNPSWNVTRTNEYLRNRWNSHVWKETTFIKSIIFSIHVKLPGCSCCWGDGVWLRSCIEDLKTRRNDIYPWPMFVV